MRWILVIITALMLLMGVIVLIGGLLPRDHEAGRVAVFAAAPSEVYAVVADLEAMPTWRSDLVDVRPLDLAPADPAASSGSTATATDPVPASAEPPDIPPGAQAAYREVGARGPVTLAVLERDPPRRLVLYLAGMGPGFVGTWTFDLAPDPAGTRLTLTERGEIENPVFRFLSRFVIGYTTAIDAYLDDLGAHLRGPGAGAGP
ncbi:SRPBCC family protein [Haliangium sp.]|uniref:SRPBCC family protein n=1 Tax=Haliangium sp. TaxID=2663208 RepID=UPI003D116923